MWPASLRFGSNAVCDRRGITLLQAFDSSALGGGVGGGGIMGRDADQSNLKTDGPDSSASNDPAVS